MLGCLQSNLLYEAMGAWVLLSGVLGFAARGFHTARGARREWRIPEATLFAVALAGGAIGMAVGSEVFRHKTSKLGFLAVLYAAVILWLLLMYGTGFLGCLFTYLPH